MTRGRELSATGLALLLAGMSMVGPFSIDTFFPSFRAIATEFSVSDLQMQQTLTAYLLPYGLMALFYGPLSDSFGRRKIIVFALLMYIVASIACALAPSFGTLLGFRGAQGATAGAGFTVGRAIVRDLHAGAQAQKLLARITMIFGLAPAIAPIIGGWLHVRFGWRSTFVFMTFIGVALALATFVKLPETHPPSARVPFRFGSLLATSWRIFTHGRFFLLAVALGINFSSVLLYIGAAPSIVLEHWQLGETQFAWLFIPVIGGFVVGAYVSGQMAGRVPSRTQMHWGLGSSAAAATAIALAHLVWPTEPIFVQQLLIFALAVGAQIISPVITLEVLDLFPQNRGAVSSVQAFISVLMAAVTMGLLVPVFDDSLLHLALTSLTGVSLSWVVWRLASR